MVAGMSGFRKPGGVQGYLAWQKWERCVLQYARASAFPFGPDQYDELIVQRDVGKTTFFPCRFGWCRRFTTANNVATKIWSHDIVPILSCGLALLGHMRSRRNRAEAHAYFKVSFTSSVPAG